MAAPRTLLLLRHAKSSWEDRDARDEDRGLAPRGERAAAALGVWLRQAGLTPDLVLCSPSERTRQTLAGVLETLRPEPLPEIREDAALYLATGSTILERVAAEGGTQRRILVVAHEPGIAEAARSVARGPAALRARIGEKFPTGGLAQIGLDDPWADLSPGCGFIEAFVVPKQLM